MVNFLSLQGRVSNFRGAANASRGVSSSAVHPGYLPNMSASSVRSGELSSPNQQMSPR